MNAVCMESPNHKTSRPTSSIRKSVGDSNRQNLQQRDESRSSLNSSSNSESQPSSLSVSPSTSPSCSRPASPTKEQLAEALSKLKPPSPDASKNPLDESVNTRTFAYIKKAAQQMPSASTLESSCNFDDAPAAQTPYTPPADSAASSSSSAAFATDTKDTPSPHGSDDESKSEGSYVSSEDRQDIVSTIAASAAIIRPAHTDTDTDTTPPSLQGSLVADATQFPNPEKETQTRQAPDALKPVDGIITVGSGTVSASPKNPVRHVDEITAHGKRKATDKPTFSALPHNSNQGTKTSPGSTDEEIQKFEILSSDASDEGQIPQPASLSYEEILQEVVGYCHDDIMDLIDNLLHNEENLFRDYDVREARNILHKLQSCSSCDARRDLRRLHNICPEAFSLIKNKFNEFQASSARSYSTINKDKFPANNPTTAHNSVLKFINNRYFKLSAGTALVAGGAAWYYFTYCQDASQSESQEVNE